MAGAAKVTADRAADTEPDCASVDMVRGQVLALLNKITERHAMRTRLITVSLAAFLLLQSPAFAQGSVADKVIAWIVADGYTVTDVKRSWLGRIVITAKNNINLREVVLNRISGEVLRDQRFPNTTENSSQSSPSTLGDRENRGRPSGLVGRGGPGGPGGE